MTDLFNVVGSNDTVKWHAEPTTRGTFSILSTCFITLVLCVWSSVHPNLPGNGGKLWQRRLRWVVSGLLAPEFLILTAWQQRQTAKRILKEGFQEGLCSGTDIQVQKSFRT